MGNVATVDAFAAAADAPDVACADAPAFALAAAVAIVFVLVIAIVNANHTRQGGFS